MGIPDAILIGLSYVLVIYVASYIVCRHGWRERDHPLVIKARILATLFMAILVRTLLKDDFQGGLSVTEVGWTLLLLSPLVLVRVAAQLERLPSAMKRGKRPHTVVLQVVWADISAILELVRQKDLPTIRNILVGPFAEERVFRQALFAVLPPFQFRWWSTLIFALAHCHGLLVGETVESVLVQFLFTLAFGYYVGGVYMRSRSVATCFVVHALCNLVGFPDPDDFIVLSAPLKIAAASLLGFGVFWYACAGSLISST